MTKRSRRLTCSLIILLSAFSFQLRAAHADTIRTTGGDELKGIVVEDYKDRVIFSTVDGEKTILKSRIKELYVDSEEDNLLRLAERAKDRGEYGRSYDYYSMVLKINPASRQAKDGVTNLSSYLFRQEEIRKEEDIKRQESIDKFGAMITPQKQEDEAVREAAEGLRDRLGITLVMNGPFPKVENISKTLGAYQAGMRKGDLVMSVWGRLTGYMKLGDVMAALSGENSLEIKCVIERTVDVRVARGGFFPGPAKMIGASLSMEFDGLTVKDVESGSQAEGAGIEKGDLITAIDGQSTRYMPIKKAVGVIRKAAGGKIKLTIRKELVLWRNGG